MNIITPITKETVDSLVVGDIVTISGNIFCGRDAVLPRIIELLDRGEINQDIFKGSVVFHTAISPAGVGPTSSNKLDIENSIKTLSKYGVKMHLGKGKLHKNTINELEKYNSLYAIIPPVTALLTSEIIEQEVIAFPELGMEAFYRIKIKQYSAVIAAAHGRSIYD